MKSNKEIIEELYMQGDWAVKMMHDPTAWKELAIQALYQKDKEKTEIVELKISLLRQWLNEARITDPKKLVSNEMIKEFLN